MDYFVLKVKNINRYGKQKKQFIDSYTQRLLGLKNAKDWFRGPSLALTNEFYMYTYDIFGIKYEKVIIYSDNDVRDKLRKLMEEYKAFIGKPLTYACVPDRGVISIRTDKSDYRTELPIEYRNKLNELGFNEISYYHTNIIT